MGRPSRWRLYTDRIIAGPQVLDYVLPAVINSRGAGEHELDPATAPVTGVNGDRCGLHNLSLFIADAPRIVARGSIRKMDILGLGFRSHMNRLPVQRIDGFTISIDFVR